MGFGIKLLEAFKKADSAMINGFEMYSWQQHGGAVSVDLHGTRCYDFDQDDLIEIDAEGAAFAQPVDIDEQGQPYQPVGDLVVITFRKSRPLTEEDF